MGKERRNVLPRAVRGCPELRLVGMNPPSDFLSVCSPAQCIGVGKEPPLVPGDGVGGTEITSVGEDQQYFS